MTELGDSQYRALARFRYAVRKFLRASEQEARRVGLTPAQHQLLLVIRGCGRDGALSLSELAEQLQQRHHSVVELVDRAEASGLVVREQDPTDRRRHLVRLTARGARVLGSLAEAHRRELGRFRHEMAQANQELR